LYTWIDSFSLLAAWSAFLAAAIIDVRTLRIPNCLTFPLILLGLSLLGLRCIAGFSIPLAGLTCAVSYAFIYGLWKLRLWGGGDAKLVLASYLLVSPVYPPLFYIAAFSLCLAIVLFFRHVIFRRVEKAIRRPDIAAMKGGPLSAEDIASLKEPDAGGPMGPMLFLAYVLSIAALTVGHAI
jgi:Flp pilus assembly protein protease CpaA